MKNTKKHAVGDVVYLQQYCWPAGICKYTVDGIKTQTGYVDVYFLQSSEHQALKRSAWAYEVFDNTDDAFAYKYLEEYQKVA
jgi:hypothetical protein